MNGQWYKHLIGARTIKTGIAIFLTAVFCMALDLTPIYAILTAVVTIEPTAKASLIKGYRRLPATVIGAGFAVLFTYLFGDQSPFTYALSATFTILFCTKLKLQVGTNVAVLTSLAMIPGIHDAYIFNFLSRTLTAIIGLVTSGLINFMVFPPKYYGQVEEKLSKTDALMYKLFYNRCQEIILSRLQSDKSEKAYKNIFNLNNQVETLISYQRDELSYHKKKECDWKLLNQLTKRAYTNRLFITHLSNIIYLPKNTRVNFSGDEKMALLKISSSIKDIFYDGSFKREDDSVETLRSTIKALEISGENQIKSHILYEVLMIYRLLDSRYAQFKCLMLIGIIRYILTLSVILSYIACPFLKLQAYIFRLKYSHTPKLRRDVAVFFDCNCVSDLNH